MARNDDGAAPIRLQLAQGQEPKGDWEQWESVGATRGHPGSGAATVQQDCERGQKKGLIGQHGQQPG